MKELRMLILKKYGTVRAFAIEYGVSESMMSHILAGEKPITDELKFSRLLSIDVNMLKKIIEGKKLTNREKFKEVFGFEISEYMMCPVPFEVCGYEYKGGCRYCNHKFWDMEYNENLDEELKKICEVNA